MASVCDVGPCACLKEKRQCYICQAYICQYCYKSPAWVITNYDYYSVVKVKDLINHDISAYDHLYFVCNEVCLDNLIIKILNSGTYPRVMYPVYNSSDDSSDDSGDHCDMCLIDDRGVYC